MNMFRNRACISVAAFGAYVLMLLPTAAPVQAQAGIALHGAWVREATGGRSGSAAYVVIENLGKTDQAVVAASSDAARALELHEMKMTGGMMRMSQVKEIVVPAGGRVELRPGGLHIMLFDVTRPLKAGDTIPLTLAFKDGTSVKTTAQVRAAEGARDEHGGPGTREQHQ